MPMVTGLTAITLMIFSRSVAWFGRLRPLTGLLWVLVIVLPWLVAITIVTKGAFFTEALGKDLLAKVGTGQESHGAPPGTYLAAFWGTFWPVAPFFALAIPFVWRHRRERGVLFALAWIIPSWLIFEAVATKLPHYVLPLYPAFAILVGTALFRDELKVDAIWKKLVGILVPFVPVVLAVAVPVGLYWLNGILTPAATALTLVAAALSIVSYRYLLRDDAASSLVAVAAAAVLYAGVYQFAFPRAEAIWLSPRLADTVVRSAPCRDPLLATTRYREPSLVFLTRTDLAMMKDDEAATFLAEPGCRVAFIRSRGEPDFLARATELGFTPRVLGRVAPAATSMAARPSTSPFTCARAPSDERRDARARRRPSRCGPRQPPRQPRRRRRDRRPSVDEGQGAEPARRPALAVEHHGHNSGCRHCLSLSR
ncbi:MAG: hypothetical protein R3D02_09330 [Hyphomicrobiales bacterium]